MATMRFINLRKFRKERDLKQNSLAAMAGLQQSAVSYLENGYQEVTDVHLEALQQAFPDVNFSEYIYEQDSFPTAIVTNRPDLKHWRRLYQGDWNKPSPIDNIQGHDILVKLGRINITGDGDMFLDKNDGTLASLGYYHISVKRLSDTRLLHSLTQKSWFDENMYENFKRCYAIACKIAGVSPVEQES